MKQKLLWLCLAVLTSIVVSCNGDEPDMKMLDSFESVADGKIWEITSKTFFNSDGEEFLLAQDGGVVPNVNSPNDGFYFNGNEIIEFYHFIHSNPPEHDFQKGTFIYDSSTGWLTADMIIVDYPALPEYVSKILIESVSEDQIIIRMNFGCLWGNFPDRDRNNPNYSPNDEGSYARCVLKPVEDPQAWWELYAPNL